MAERKRLTDRHVTIHGALPSLVRRKLSWPVLVIALALMVVPATAVHFFDRVSYQNSLNQQQAQYYAAQRQLGQQQSDLKHIIGTVNTQLNCLQLQSDSAKQTCRQHDADTPL